MKMKMTMKMKTAMKRMRIWVIAALLVAIPAGALAGAPPKALARAIEIIGTEESGHNYGCAETDTNGKSSLGFIQWNAGLAAGLLKKIIAQDERAAVSILGEELTAQLKGAKDCQLSRSELKVVSVLLKSDAGRAVQDAQAKTDIAQFIESAMALGIKDPTALAYYADIRNQVGSGAIKKYHTLAAEKAGGYDKVRLDDLYESALVYATRTKARRTRVYKLLKENPVGDEAVAPPVEQLTLSGAHTMKRNTRQTLTATLGTQAASPLRWKSSRPKVASVNRQGEVRAKKKGTTIIACKFGKQVVKFKLKVQ
ncbi:MAG: Ig-like domain-containing protein [Clostridia bacterium]